MGKLRRRLTKREMRIVLAIERNIDDRRGFHIRTCDPDIRRNIRESLKHILVDPQWGV